jgi:hypothetical protein
MEKCFVTRCLYRSSFSYGIRADKHYYLGKWENDKYNYRSDK